MEKQGSGNVVFTALAEGRKLGDFVRARENQNLITLDFLCLSLQSSQVPREEITNQEALKFVGGFVTNFW